MGQYRPLRVGHFGPLNPGQFAPLKVGHFAPLQVGQFRPLKVGQFGALSSQSTNKGRHVTSHRELILLENGGILVDNPGMREVGIADSTGGLETTFDQIVSLAEGCKFKDCTHTREVGCAVLEALEKGTIDQASYENFQKMEREKAHFESTVADKRKRDKVFGKMMKHYKDVTKNKFE